MFFRNPGNSRLHRAHSKRGHRIIDLLLPLVIATLLLVPGLQATETWDAEDTLSNLGLYEVTTPDRKSLFWEFGHAPVGTGLRGRVCVLKRG